MARIEHANGEKENANERQGYGKAERIFEIVGRFLGQVSEHLDSANNQKGAGWTGSKTQSARNESGHRSPSYLTPIPPTATNLH